MEDVKNPQNQDTVRDEGVKNKGIDVVFVNDDYEKISRRKKEVLLHNANTIKINNEVKRAKRGNVIFTLLFSLLVSGGLSAYIWFNFNIHIANLSIFASKLTTIAVVVLLVFLLNESASYIYKVGIEKKIQTVKDVTEAMNFVTFIHGKKLKDYTVSAYEDVPYETQKVYLTVYAEDENAKDVEYTSLDKWNLVLLPVLFDVIIDAEHTTIYLPCKNEDMTYEVRGKFREEIVLEQIKIEKEARAQAEQTLTHILNEKDAMERILTKTKDKTVELEAALSTAKTELESVEDRHKATIEGMILECNKAKQNETVAKKDLNTANEKTRQLDEENSALKTEIATLKMNEEKATEDNKKQLAVVIADLNAEKLEKNRLAYSVREKDNAIQALNERLSQAENSLKLEREQNTELTAKLNDTSEKEAHEQQMSELIEKHNNEIEALKQRINRSVQEAKSSIEQKYNAEIVQLKQENARLSSADKMEVLTHSLNEKEKALKNEIQLREARENELDFERDKVKILEEKLYNAEEKIKNVVHSLDSEKTKLINELEKQKQINSELERQKSAVNASAGVQERALLKEKNILENQIKILQEQLDSAKDVNIVRQENVSLKAQLEKAKNESVEDVRSEYEQKIVRIKDERDRAEKKMREALEAVSREKTERIKSEDALRQYVEKQEKLENERKLAVQEAELAKAREAAARAQQDALKAKVGMAEGTQGERKKPTRKLNL